MTLSLRPLIRTRAVPATAPPPMLHLLELSRRHITIVASLKNLKGALAQLMHAKAAHSNAFVSSTLV